MQQRKHVVITTAVIAYSVLFFAMYARLHGHVMIISIALPGICGWYYGVQKGLFSVIFTILLNLGLMFMAGASHQETMRTLNPFCMFFTLIVAASTGLLRKSYNDLQHLKKSLTERINEATCEREALTNQLIERDEKERIRIGQDLHDNVGQYLTSMLLYSETLYRSLGEESGKAACLVESIKQQVEKSIQTVRRLSRSLLPIQSSEASFETALGEMTAYFSDSTEAKLHLSFNGCSANIPVSATHTLYRIIHETVHRAISKYKASYINIIVNISNNRFQGIVYGGNRILLLNQYEDLISEVMKYRAESINGEILCTAKNGFKLVCSADLDKEGQ